jgi:hypothetical protein
VGMHTAGMRCIGMCGIACNARGAQRRCAWLKNVDGLFTQCQRFNFKALRMD